jgi:enoyl-[acyl-carrier protein] reductase III
LANGNIAYTNWALILGASSGFGAATARVLAHRGLNIVGIHLDSKATLPNAQAVQADIEDAGRQAIFINMNAASEEKRTKAIERMAEANVKVKIMLHSLAFGSLKPMVGETREESLDQKNIEMTLDVMASSMVYWIQDLVWANLFADDARIFCMTSEGNERVMLAYGAVSAAKVAMESYVRQLAIELAPRNIKINAIQAGVTDTPALRAIPGNEEWIELARRRNPFNRLTTTDDVAHAIYELSRPGACWMTGNVIRVDGGEFVVP